MSKTLLKKDHGYYVLTHPPASPIQQVIQLPVRFFSIVRWAVSFLFALFSLPWFKGQAPVHSASIDNHPHLIIDLTPQTALKPIVDTLLKFNNVGFSLPFAAPIQRKRLHLDDAIDKAYIDQQIKQLTQLIASTSQEHTSGAPPSLDWQHIHFKGLEYLDDDLHAYFLDELAKKHGNTAVFTKREIEFNFFSLQTPQGSVLDSVEIPAHNEQDKPITERTFIIHCLKHDQNYLQSLDDFQKIATNKQATVIGFNYQGHGHSKGLAWTTQDCATEIAAQVERLLLLGANKNNIIIENASQMTLNSDDIFKSIAPVNQTMPASTSPQVAPNTPRRPCIVACSGGTGHITAALGIIDTLRRQDETIRIPTHQARLRQDDYSLLQMSLKTWGRAFSLNLSMMLNKTILGTPLKKITHFLGYPDLPDYHAFQHEVTRLTQTETSPTAPKNHPLEGRERPYIDLLLDLQLSGYESAAIFNSLQRHDQTDEIDALVQYQEYNDRWNYHTVYHRFLDTLKNAVTNNTPFTDVIVTHPQSLAALCDAVITYNEEYLPAANQDKRRTPLTPLSIHLYMSDLPTRGATHFLHPIARLTEKQKQQMELYAVDIPPAIHASYLDHGHDFKHIHNLRADQNPMIRSGFSDERLRSHYLDTSNPMVLPIKEYTQIDQQLRPKNEQSFIDIPADATVASIMLGSLASHASIDYVKHLLNHGYEHIFVFGGLNPDIDQGIDALINTYPASQHASLRERIVRLGNQSDQEIAPIMTRSDCVIIRGGGLSTMEQMALPQRKNKIVMVHHNDNNDNSPLSSGLSWEDGNTERLIAHLTAQQVFARKTSPHLVSSALQEATTASSLASTAVTLTSPASSPQTINPIKDIISPLALSQNHPTRFFSRSTRDAGNDPYPEQNRPQRTQ